MKLRITKKLYIFAGALLISTVLAAPSTAEPIVIDHTTTDLSQIPNSAIMQAKSTLHIAYGHTSHGSQLTSGMGSSGASCGLDTFLTGNPNYPAYTPGLCRWVDDGGAVGSTPGYIDLDNYFVSGDLGNPDRTTWASRTRGYLGTPITDTNNPDYGRGTTRPEINVIIWSWCGQVDGSEADIDTYLDLMNQLEIDYPNVTFVYMTGHLNGTGANGNVNIRNNQIREYCTTNDKVLYDFADIESFDPVWDTAYPNYGTNYMVLNGRDTCAYDGGNWALEWQAAHTQNTDWWASGAAHSQNLNGNLKGYAAWWLWARIAGWGECTDAPTGLIASYNSGTGDITLNWTDNSSEEDEYVVQRREGTVSWNDYATGLAPNTTTFIDTSPDLVSECSYRVAAGILTPEACNSGYSNVALDPRIPQTPLDLTATPDQVSQEITLNWTDNSDNEDEFIIQRQTSGNPLDYSEYDTVVSEVTTYTDIMPVLDISNYYRVIASNSFRDSTPSNEASAVVTTGAPPPPSDLQAALSGTVINLTWQDNSTNENYFVLERMVDAGEFIVLDDEIPADEESYPDGLVTPGHTYTYRVLATNNDGDSAYSNEASQYVPVEPTTLTISSTADVIDAFLDNNNPDTNYGSTTYKTDVEHFIIKFILPEYLHNKLIVNAEFNIYSYASSYSSENNLDVYRVTREWDESEVTWNIAEAGIAWSTPGGDYDELVGSFNMGNGADHSYFSPALNITDLVQQWTDQTVDNKGILVTNADEFSLGIKASEYTSRPPTLEITYECYSDRDSDLDVDGSDLSQVAANPDYDCLDAFTVAFGKVTP